MDYGMESGMETEPPAMSMTADSSDDLGLEDEDDMGAEDSAAPEAPAGYEEIGEESGLEEGGGDEGPME